jgi:hypothetical protein
MAHIQQACKLYATDETASADDRADASMIASIIGFYDISCKEFLKMNSLLMVALQALKPYKAGGGDASMDANYAREMLCRNLGITPFYEMIISDDDEDDDEDEDNNEDEDDDKKKDH